MNDLNSEVERAYRRMQEAPLDPLEQLAEAQKAPPIHLPYARPAVAADTFATYPQCPVCGYRGEAVKESKGSVFVAFVLLLFGILPGLLYLMFFSGYVYKCRQCGAKKADA